MRKRMISSRPCRLRSGAPRVADAGGKTPGDAKPLLDLPQGQQAAIRGHQRAIEAGLDRLAADR